MYLSILVPLGRNPPDVQGLEIEHWANSTSTVLTWDRNAINSSRVDVEIFVFDSSMFRLHDTSLATFERIPNSGRYNLEISEEAISSQRK